MIGGIDLGSVWLAAVVGEDELPLRLPVAPLTLGVDERSPEIVVAVVVKFFIRSGVTRAAIEFGRFFAGDAPTSGGATASANAWGVMKVLEHLFARELRAAGIEVLTVGRRTWSSRLVPHHQGGISNAESNAGVKAKCAPEAWATLSDRGDGVDPQHRIDAAGVLLGAWLVEPARRLRHHKYRDRRKDKTKERVELTLEQKLQRKREGNVERQRKFRGTLTLEALEMLGCRCWADKPRRGGRHKLECPIEQERQRVKREQEREAVERARAHGPFLPAPPPRPPRRLI